MDVDEHGWLVQAREAKRQKREAEKRRREEDKRSKQEQAAEAKAREQARQEEASAQAEAQHDSVGISPLSSTIYAVAVLTPQDMSTDCTSYRECCCCCIILVHPLVYMLVHEQSVHE